MTPNEAQELIKIADTVRVKIAGYRFYDKPIDTENITHLLVAAYFLGIVEASVPPERKRATPGLSVV